MFLRLLGAYLGYSTTQMFYGQQQCFALARQQGLERVHGYRKCNGLQISVSSPWSVVRSS